MKYFLAFVLPLGTLISLYFQGVWSYFTIFLAFVAIPIIELSQKANPNNSSPLEEMTISVERFYDILLYAVVPVHFSTLFYFLYTLSVSHLTGFEIIGLTLSMGIQCGAIGINVAHELGHRKSKFERILAKSLLMTSLYMHFIVEHNRGHHTYVATPKDPATARKNEPIYTYWFRTIIFSFVSAWKIERSLMSKQGKSTWSLKNEMIQLILIETAFVFTIYWVFGITSFVAFLGAALLGIVLLESVNYVEHYGLLRKEVSPGKYERVKPWHSWNSDYPLGRIMLFELTRHSDHHYLASRKYQILRHLPESPQLPTGYPGSILLSLVPPLWFKVMNPKVDALEAMHNN